MSYSLDDFVATFSLKNAGKQYVGSCPNCGGYSGRDMGVSRMWGG